MFDAGRHVIPVPEVVAGEGRAALELEYTELGEPDSLAASCAISWSNLEAAEGWFDGGRHIIPELESTELGEPE